jgi:drug/metabolite transporter (DMT)-like permease
MVVIWGVNFIVIKDALRQMQPIVFNGLRFALAATVIAGLVWWRGEPRPGGRDIGRLALLGLLGNTVYQFGFIEGVARTRAGNAALIMAAVPVQTALLSHLLGRARLRGRDVAGLALAAAGITTIVAGSGSDVGFGGTMHGDLLMLFATVCWSLYTVAGKPMVDRFGPLTTTAWTMGLGALPMLVMAVPPLMATDWDRVGPDTWGAMVFSSLGALVLAYIVWYRGVQRLGPSHTTMYSNFVPVVAMLAAWAFLGEVPTAWQGVGALGIFGGIYLTRT